MGDAVGVGRVREWIPMTVEPTSASLFARDDGPEGVEDALRTARGHLEITIGAQAWVQ